MTTEYWMDAFERMKPFVDDGWGGDGWRPSELLRIGYCMVASGPEPKRANAWATMMLTKARQRFREGHSANPFSAEPTARTA